MKFKLDPTKKLVLMLAILATFATAVNFENAGPQILLHLSATLGFSLILYWIFTKLFSKKKNIWNTVITGLIIFLVLHYGDSPADVIYPLIAVFIAMFQKFFIEYKASPIVNPAAASLLLMAAVVALLGFDDAFISWWGTSFRGPIPLVAVLLWIFFGLNKWRKYPTLISFLVAHVLVLMFRGEGYDFIKYIFTDSTIYFFAAVMLIEPRTSPAKYQQQVYYGLAAALAYNILAQYNAPYFELFALVAANLTNMIMRPNFKKRKKVAIESAEE